MKENKLLAGLIAWLLSFGIAMGGVGCMVSGFLLEPESLTSVAIWCGICTAVCCVCWSAKKGGLVLLGLAVLLGSFFYREGSLPLQVESLLNKISKVYNMAYDCGTIKWSDMYLGDIPVDMGLALIASVCGGVAAYPLCRGKNALLPMTVCMLPLFSCMIVTDSVPGEGWLFLLLASLLLVVLTNTLRRRSAADGVRITAILAVPVLLAMTLIFVLVPRDGYSDQAGHLSQSVFSWFEYLSYITGMTDGQLGLTFNGDSADKVDLTSIGPKTSLKYAVMDVTAEKGGTLYLRGQSFDTYNGVNWDYTDYTEKNAHAYWPTDALLKPAGTVTISVRRFRDFRYMPYYLSQSDMERLYRVGWIDNPDKLKTYSFNRYELMASTLGDRGEMKYARYLQLYVSTQNAARKFLRENGIVAGATSASSIKGMAEAIGKLVQNSADYSLNTPKMPQGEQDFAMWFLNKMDTGYCVHFATAATVLLRAYGIPARYVTGYTCEAVAGQPVTVTADKAHAWVEYYDRSVGWRVLDPTPGGGNGTGGGTPDPDVEITRPTRPVVTPTYPVNDTTEPVETTQPSETTGETEPVETTQPSTGATEPSGGGSGIGGGGTGTGSGKQLWSIIKPLLIGLAWIAGTAGVLWGQYLLRRNHRRKQMHTGHHNKRALARWREALRMARVTKTTPPEALEALAEKAKFSQHTLTVAELMEFDAWLQEQSRKLNSRNLLYRLLCKLVWAVE